MKKPEKKVFNSIMDYSAESRNMIHSYNQAIDDYEKFLPSEEEILNILDEFGKHTPDIHRAKVIAKRIGVK